MPRALCNQQSAQSYQPTIVRLGGCCLLLLSLVGSCVHPVPMLWGHCRTLVLILSRGKCRRGVVHHRGRGERGEKDFKIGLEEEGGSPQRARRAQRKGFENRVRRGERTTAEDVEPRGHRQGTTRKGVRFEPMKAGSTRKTCVYVPFISFCKYPSDGLRSE